MPLALQSLDLVPLFVGSKVQPAAYLKLTAYRPSFECPAVWKTPAVCGSVNMDALSPD